MKARKGFIATLLAVMVAMILLLTSAYLISMGVGTVREEARITEETQRSLYPVAWSTTNFVLLSLKDAYMSPTLPRSLQTAAVFLDGNINTSPISTDIVSFTVKVGPDSNLLDVFVSCDVTGSAAGRIKVESTARTYRPGWNERITSVGILSKDVTDPSGWKIVWR